MPERSSDCYVTFYATFLYSLYSRYLFTLILEKNQYFDQKLKFKRTDIWEPFKASSMRSFFLNLYFFNNKDSLMASTVKKNVIQELLSKPIKSGQN